MYSDIQRRYFARELARSGGNVEAAAEALRTQYEDMRGVGATTLRRFLREKGAGEMIATESQWLAKIAGEVATERERDRFREEITGSEMERLARDESILDDLRSLVKDALDKFTSSPNSDGLPVKQIVDLYERMTRVHDNRRARVLPALAGTRDTTLLMRIIAEESMAMFGSQTPKFIQRIRDRFLREHQDAAPVTSTEAK